MVIDCYKALSGRSDKSTDWTFTSHSRAQCITKVAKRFKIKRIDELINTHRWSSPKRWVNIVCAWCLTWYSDKPYRCDCYRDDPQRHIRTNDPMKGKSNDGT